MSFHRLALGLLTALAVPVAVLAQAGNTASARLFLELNTVQDVGEACRLTFLVRNETGTSIDKAVFETVIFDRSDGVISLSLFNFRDMPADRPRVRQFELPDIACDSVGQVLINGANSCIVDGAESAVCETELSPNSRLDVELLG
ncbi:hypothetical protein I5535_16955 [Rhodobacteraceae bacterium F11138]|nr:hypothetical protein [Rhodobacteraceae bacterium F11138]